jgi:hypothetical protein
MVEYQKLIYKQNGMPKNFSQKGFTKNFLQLMKQEEKNKECCLDFLTQIYTENSATILFGGLGTSRSPLTATAVGGSSGSSAVVTENSSFIDFSGNGTAASPLIASLDPSGGTNGLQNIGGKLGLGGSLIENTTIGNGNGVGNYNIILSGINFDSDLAATMTINTSNNNFIQYVSANAHATLDLYIRNTLAGTGSASGIVFQNDVPDSGFIALTGTGNNFVSRGMYLVNQGGVGGILLSATAGPITFNNGLTQPISSSEYARFSETGQFALGTNSPLGRLTILGSAAGVAGTGAIVLLPGTLLTVLQRGAVEFTDDGTTGHLYITLNQSGTLTRVQIV